MSTRDLKHKFNRLYSFIDILEIKLNAKSGFWVFKSHIYTYEQLLESKTHKDIYSYSELIHNLVEHWIENNKFDVEERNFYNHERDVFEERLHEINIKMAERQPTWWESLKEPLTKFVVMVMNLLPTRYQSLLHHVGAKLLGYSETGVKKSYKLLIDKIKS